MPTDETTLEALVNLVERKERRAQHDEALVLDGEASSFYVKRAIESRLIADALRFRLAALTAPAAQDTAEVLALLDGADGSGCGPDDTFTLYLPLHRARRLHALVTARIAHDEEARSAATLPRGGADS